MQKTSNDVAPVSQSFAVPLVSQWFEMVTGRDTDSKVLAALVCSAFPQVRSDTLHIQDREVSDLLVAFLRTDIRAATSFLEPAVSPDVLPLAPFSPTGNPWKKGLFKAIK